MNKHENKQVYEITESISQNTGNKRIQINNILCYLFEFQGTIYYPSVKFILNTHSSQLKREVYDIEGHLIGILEFNIDTYNYDIGNLFDFDYADNEYEEYYTYITRYFNDMFGNNKYNWNTELPYYFIIYQKYNIYYYILPTEKLVAFYYNVEIETTTENIDILTQFRLCINGNNEQKQSHELRLKNCEFDINNDGIYYKYEPEEIFPSLEYTNNLK